MPSLRTTTPTCLASFWLAVLVFSSGCSTSPVSQFYVLEARTPSAIPAFDATVVAIGPVELPAYLDRPQLVSREAQNKISIAEFHRWAEPLPGHVTTTLAENIQAARNDLRVVPYPWPTGTQVHRQVHLRITAMEAGPQGQALIAGAWELRQRETGALLYAGRFDVRRDVEGRDPAAKVAALSQAVQDLAEMLAAKLPDGRAPL